MNYTIRFATSQDVAVMYNISRAAHRLEDYGQFLPVRSRSRFQAHYRWSKRRRTTYVEKISQLISSKDATVVVAEVSKGLIGYAVMRYDEEEGYILQGLFVRPAWQGKGVGKELFRAACIQVAPKSEIFLDVLAKNKKAIRLYEGQGFRVVERQKKRFFGAQLLRMKKTLH